jgi:apolipoprotein N-acyltransferase
MILFAGVFNWILEVPGYRLIHHALLTLYMGSYVGVFGFFFNFIFRRWNPVAASLAAPFLWVSLEFIRSNLSFLSLPWALLAHSQYQYSSVIQISSLTGTYSISFFIVMVNACLALAILALRTRLRPGGALNDFVYSKEELFFVMLTTVAAGVLVLSYGLLVLSKPVEGKELRVSVVQGNIEQGRKWDPGYAEFIMKTYAGLTQKASEQNPGLIVWPETATPASINQDITVRYAVRSIAKKVSAPILLGSAIDQKTVRRSQRRRAFTNSAYLINPEEPGRIQQHDKVRLFPFGEYIPMRGVVPWHLIDIPDMGSYVPGKEFTVFSLGDVRFGVIICWENIFPDLTREFVRNGAQFIVNIANEAWFGKTASPRQFLSISVFRAVENRVFMVRCVNTGISCFIDPYGRILDRVTDETGQDLSVRGVLTGIVVSLDSRTFYTQYGDWFCWFSVGGSIVFLVTAFVKSRLRNRQESLGS